MEEEALNRTPWVILFGGNYGSIVRQTIEWMKEWG